VVVAAQSGGVASALSTLKESYLQSLAVTPGPLVVVGVAGSLQIASLYTPPEFGVGAYGKSRMKGLSNVCVTGPCGNEHVAGGVGAYALTLPLVTVNTRFCQQS